MNFLEKQSSGQSSVNALLNQFSPYVGPRACLKKKGGVVKE
jgi:hypothetical protein